MKENKISKHIKSPKVILNVVFVVLILLGLYFLFRNGNFDKLKAVSHQLNYWLLAAVLAINLINLFMVILRWYFLVKPVKNDVSLKNIYIISLNAIAANFAVPGKMGVPAKAILLKNTEGINYSHSTPSLINELLLEYCCILIFFIVSSTLGNFMKWTAILNLFSRKFGFVFVIILAIAVVAYIVISKQKMRYKTFKNIEEAFRISWLRKDLFSIALGITVINLFLTFWCDKILFRALGFDIRYIFIIFSSAFSNIASLLSPLPGGIGIREIANGYFYKKFYGLGEVAILAVLIRRIITYLSLIILFIIEKGLVLGVSQSEKVVHEDRLY